MSILNKEKILEQARVFIEEGKYDKAIREYEKILLADHGDLRVKLRVAELYTKRKQIGDAIRLYREVADAYVEEGFFLKAVTVNKNILRLNPSLVGVNEQLAILYEKMGLISDAIRQYSIVASTLQSKGQTERVLAIREKIVNMKPDDGASRVKLAETYQREGKMDEAVNQYEEYARQLEASGKNEIRLAETLEKILAHRPDNHDMLKKLIDIYMRAGDKKKALKWLELGKTFVDKDAHLLKLQAEIYASQNQNETARSKYMALADLYKEAGDTDSALESYFEILVILPDEEERFFDIVEDIRAGAMQELAARAQKRRQEIEEKAQLKENEGGQEGRKGDRKEDAKQDLEIKTSPLKFREPEDAGESRRAPPPDQNSLKDADAAFDLGSTYRKMGLMDESMAEFEKARAIYVLFLNTDLETDHIRDRLNKIGSTLGGVKSEEKQEPAGGDEREKKKECAKAGKKEEPPFKPQKKKISFV